MSSSDCNNTTTPICQPCSSTLVNDPCATGCLDIYATSCIQYDGPNLSCLGINTGDYLNNDLCALNNLVCTLQTQSGGVKVNDGDTCPGTLMNKLVAGANIVFTGIGTGCNTQLRIDSVLGGQIVDQLVKVSPTDQTAGFLSSKISFGPCVYAQTVNPGLNETYQILIDWQCALNQLSQLPGFCTLVNNCLPVTAPLTCPFITLNNPTISGSSATFTWVSSGTTYNVYVDGVLQTSTPTTSTSFSTGTLTNGSHTVNVVAICNAGTPNTASQTFSINTVCPVPSGLTVGILSGGASLAWSIDSSANSQNLSVQYKLDTAINWTTVAAVSPITTSYTITGLSQNRLYDFQIVNNCSTGGPSPSTLQKAIEFTCPVVTLTPTSTGITYSFPSIGGDITSYTLALYDSGGINLIQSKTESAPFNSTITNSFSGLTSNTTYQVKVTVNAGTFNKVCAPQTVTTPNVPSCPTVTNLNIIVS